MSYSKDELLSPQHAAELAITNMDNVCASYDDRVKWMVAYTIGVRRECAEELSEERKRADEAEKDAKRYRALRNGGSMFLPRVVDPIRSDISYMPEGLDSAIDEAIKNG
jgi:hypothetical protein